MPSLFLKNRRVVEGVIVQDGLICLVTFLQGSNNNTYPPKHQFFRQNMHRNTDIITGVRTTDFGSWLDEFILYPKR